MGLYRGIKSQRKAIMDLLMEADKIDKLVQLAARTGILYAASDVYDQLRNDSSTAEYRGYLLLLNIKLVEAPLLQPGTIMAIDPQLLGQPDIPSY